MAGFEGYYFQNRASDDADWLIILFEDDIHLFTAEDSVVEWDIGDRMIAVSWTRPAWEKFRIMVAEVGHAPWTSL